MSTEKDPLEKEKIINEDENLQIEPETESDGDNEESPELAGDVVAPADDDGGGSAPNPSKERD